jgi:hypothetical protein
MSQNAFAAALLDPELPAPPGVTGPDGQPDAKRFAVYRNNVAASLTRALQAAFPCAEKLVGPEFFGAMAQVYLRAHPPKDRRLMLYGADFAEFLADFPPVSHLAYLPDVARLEQAMRVSYHAADHIPLPPETLAEMTEAQLLHARFTFAPSMQLLASSWPVQAIWAANMRGGPAPKPGPQEVAILRAEFDPEPCLLPPGGVAFLRSLSQGQPLIAALAAAGEGFDLTAILGLLIQHRALAGVSR